jgi:hypothetical protein
MVRLAAVVDILYPIYVWAFCRTDYQLATPAIASLARSEHIYKDLKFSDHAPITVDYDFIV